MAKWLVTHTADGSTILQEVVNADDYTDAYLTVLHKSPAHYATGTICSGIISVIKVPDDYNGSAGLPTI